MSTTPTYVFQSSSVSVEQGAYRMRPLRPSRAGSALRPSAVPSTRSQVHVPYRRTRRLAILVALSACSAFVCFSFAYWLFTTRYDPLFKPHTTSAAPDVRLAPPDLDIPARRASLHADATQTYLAYLPHSGLHNQRIALENALVLARLLNRTLLVPPARLGPKTVRYVRAGALARLLALGDKRRGLAHCAHLPAGIPPPDECVDYGAYTLVPWAWLVDIRALAARQALVHAPEEGGTGAWLGLGPHETRVVGDAGPYEWQFVDTDAPVRVGSKYARVMALDMLRAVPERLIQLGTLFGSSRLRLRTEAHRRVRREVRREMVFANAAVDVVVERIGEALGGTYVAAHVRVGDGRFQRGARANMRVVWWKLVHDVVGLATETVLELESALLPRMRRVIAADGNDEEDETDDTLEPPEMVPDMPSLRVPHPPLPPLPDGFSPKLACRGRLHTTQNLRSLNVPLFVATDAPGGLDDPLLAPLIHAFPCTFVLSSFKAEVAHLEGLRNGYDGVPLSGYLTPIVDALVMGRAWAVVGTEGSTFSRYVADVLWRVSHGWEIVERG